MKNRKSVLWMLLSVGVLTGCQSFTGFDFDSDAIVGGGAVAGKDYITGLKPSLKAREYFVKSNANASQKKTITPGDDQGTGVVWTDDGGIVIPPGCSIEFENKGYCLDPHLPAPGAGHEMQFVRIASLLPDELQGTYRNLLKRSAAGDEDVKNNMQRLVWALRTAGSQDAMATHLTDRQREILSECAEDGSFEDFVYRQEMYGKIVEELKSKFVNKIKDSTSVRVGNVVYDAFDLLDPDKGKQKVEAHLQSLISMGLNLPVTQTGFNYGELENGIFTDIKGNGPLSFKAKIANSTSQPYTFYPMNYAAQVGSGGSSVGFYAAANSGMRQRTTIDVPEDVEVDEDEEENCFDFHNRKRMYISDLKNEIERLKDQEKRYIKALALTIAARDSLLGLLNLIAPGSGSAAKNIYDGGAMVKEGIDSWNNPSYNGGLSTTVGLGIATAEELVEKVYGTSPPASVTGSLGVLNKLGMVGEFVENASKIHSNHQRAIKDCQERIEQARRTKCSKCGRE